MWIACLQGALVDADRLASGDPLDTPSKDKRRMRWQLVWDVADMHEWLRSSDEGGLLWIESVVHSCLGPDAFDIARLQRTVVACLTKAEAIIDRLTHEVITDAVSRTKAVSHRHVSRQDDREAWLLPCPPRPRTQAVGAARQGTRRPAVAKATGANPSARQLAMPL